MCCVPALLITIAGAPIWWSWDMVANTKLPLFIYVAHNIMFFISSVQRLPYHDIPLKQESTSIAYLNMASDHILMSHRRCAINVIRHRNAAQLQLEVRMESCVTVPVRRFFCVVTAKKWSVCSILRHASRNLSATRKYPVSCSYVGQLPASTVRSKRWAMWRVSSERREKRNPRKDDMGANGSVFDVHHTSPQSFPQSGQSHRSLPDPYPHVRSWHANDQGVGAERFVVRWMVCVPHAVVRALQPLPYGPQPGFRRPRQGQNVGIAPPDRTSRAERWSGCVRRHARRIEIKDFLQSICREDVDWVRMAVVDPLVAPR